MKNLNHYIKESWGGVKKQVNKVEIEAWCDEMDIRNYTINSQGEIDVDENVNLDNNKFKELPYKFGTVKGFFSLEKCKKLTSLKNCPDYVNGSFYIDGCTQLDSLEGCPKEVKANFWCTNCKKRFAEEEVQSLCKVKKIVIV